MRERVKGTTVCRLECKMRSAGISEGQQQLGNNLRHKFSAKDSDQPELPLF